MAESNETVDIVFGNQSFPVCHPQGYMSGMNILGMAWYNGNRIVAGKLSDFQTEYSKKLVISDQLDLGGFYHVCMTYKDDGTTSLYCTKLSESNMIMYNSSCSTSEFVATDDSGNSIKTSVGASDWDTKRSDTSEPLSAMELSSYMDISMLRFYHRSLSKNEVRLLAREAKGQVFVADDFEAGTLVGNGYKPITV